MPKKTGCSVLFAVLVSALLIVGICFNATETVVHAQDNMPPTTFHGILQTSLLISPPPTTVEYLKPTTELTVGKSRT
jgi:hypothetical protein